MPSQSDDSLFNELIMSDPCLYKEHCVPAHGRNLVDRVQCLIKLKNKKSGSLDEEEIIWKSSY